MNCNPNKGVKPLQNNHTNKLMDRAASQTNPPGLLELGTVSLVSRWNGGRGRQSLVPYPSNWLFIISQAI